MCKHNRYIEKKKSCVISLGWFACKHLQRYHSSALQFVRNAEILEMDGKSVSHTSSLQTRAPGRAQELRFRGTKSRDALLLPFLQAKSCKVGFAVISGEALVRVRARDLWWDPLNGLGGGALGALGLRGQMLRCVRTVHLAVHQGKVDVVHVWQHKYFLEDNSNKKLWAGRR